MNLQATDWNKFRTFYYVAKAASFTKAAQNLHVSQPALSRRIASLEASLNVRLLERVSRGVVLTEEGKMFLEAVNAMLSVFMDYGEALQSKKGHPEGLLKVAMSKTLPSLRISGFIADFLKEYPHMRLALIESDKEVGFADYQADVAIRELSNSAPTLEQIYLTTSPVGLYANAEYLQRYGIPEKIEDLDTHCLIALGDSERLSSCSVNWALEAGLNRGKQRTPILCVNSLSSLKKAAEAGVGLAALPEEYVSKNCSLVRVLAETPLPSIDLYYVFPRHHKKTKRITACGEFLAEKFKTAVSKKVLKPHSLNGAGLGSKYGPQEQAASRAASVGT